MGLLAGKLIKKGTTASFKLSGIMTELRALLNQRRMRQEFPGAFSCHQRVDPPTLVEHYQTMRIRQE